MNKKIIMFIFALVFVLPFVTRVSAENENMAREDAATKAGSRPGLIREFAKKSKAAIGSGILKSISGTTLTVEKDGKTYTILTDSKTQFRRRFWGKATLDEFGTGDTVAVIGLWTDDTKTTVQARLVRDMSIQKRHGVFFGTVESVSDSGWVMMTVQRGNQTVTVSSTTKFINRRGETIAKADVLVGHRVRVRGLWNSTNNTITEISEVKDFALPPKPTATPTP